MNIIAYGSLMNQASLETTLGRSAQLKKLEVPGVARIFNAPFGGFAYLNLQTNPNTYIEAAYFTIDPAEVVKFAIREAGSELVELTPGCFAFSWPPDFVQTLAVLQSYIDTCKSGASVLELDFEQGLIKPASIINDLLKPQYA